MAHCVHLDYLSSAPVYPGAVEAMHDCLNSDNYDPRRLYDGAIKTRYEIETSRQKIASLINSDPFEVIFTSSSAESLASFAYGCLGEIDTSSPNIICTPYDSEVLNYAWDKAKVEKRTIDGNSEAKLNLDTLTNKIDKNTIAITFPIVHPDTGTLQETKEIIEIVKSKNPNTLIHIDARNGVGYQMIDFQKLGADVLTFEPVTYGGPAGIGVLVVARDKHLSALLGGSTQERARRAGIENIVGIIGAGISCEITSENLSSKIPKYIQYKKMFTDILEKSGAKFLVYDPESSHSLPNVISAYFEGIAASAIVAECNRAGINIHAGSSCGSEEFEPSKQLFPVTNDNAISESVFRISYGHATTENDIDIFSEAINKLTII